jgi:hypothetical protein
MLVVIDDVAVVLVVMMNDLMYSVQIEQDSFEVVIGIDDVDYQSIRGADVVLYRYMMSNEYKTFRKK